MTSEELQQNYFYHYSLDIKGSLFQMWIHQDEDIICFYEKKSGTCYLLSAQEIRMLSNTLNTAEDFFFQKRMLTEKEKQSYTESTE